MENREDKIFTRSDIIKERGERHGRHLQSEYARIWAVQGASAIRAGLREAAHRVHYLVQRGFAAVTAHR